MARNKSRGDDGVFITFEGDDGVGKSTHIRFLSDTLRSLGYEVVSLREPGGTSIGEQLRAIVLDPNNPEIAAKAELLIYEAARAQIVCEVIAPALKRGAVVLSDRFIDSTVAYQGYGRGLDISFIDAANKFATSGLMPDKTLLMTCSDGTDRLDRVGRRAIKDRLDGADKDFHDAVSRGFSEIVASDRGRIDVVDTSGARSETARLIFRALDDLFPELNDGSVDFEETLLRFDQAHKH